MARTRRITSGSTGYRLSLTCNRTCWRATSNRAQSQPVVSAASPVLAADKRTVRRSPGPSPARVAGTTHSTP